MIEEKENKTNFKGKMEWKHKKKSEEKRMCSKTIH